MIRPSVSWIPVASILVLLALTAVAVRAIGVSDPSEPATRDWPEIVDRAQGQTVRLWMWDGSAAWNGYVDRVAATTARDAGVRLERVPVSDTGEAIDLLVPGDGDAADHGPIDLVWVNGSFFARGRQAGAWLRGWVPLLPNAELLDPDDPTLWNDFGVPTDGSEAPWARAAFIFAYDRARVSAPPRSFEALLRYAWSNPGRIAYPAPPHFTGSAFVRQAVATLGEDRAFQLLHDLEPLLWKGGREYPTDSVELAELFADGEVDLAMQYNPSFVDLAVEQGDFPRSVRPYVFEAGTLQNVNFLAIPRRSKSAEGAMVVANLMLSPDEQGAKARDVGAPSVLPRRALPEASEPPSVYRLAEFGVPLAELPAARVDEIDQRWLREFGP